MGDLDEVPLDPIDREAWLAMVEKLPLSDRASPPPGPRLEGATRELAYKALGNRARRQLSDMPGHYTSPAEEELGKPTPEEELLARRDALMNKRLWIRDRQPIRWGEGSPKGEIIHTPRETVEEEELLARRDALLNQRLPSKADREAELLRRRDALLGERIRPRAEVEAETIARRDALMNYGVPLEELREAERRRGVPANQLSRGEQATINAMRQQFDHQRQMAAADLADARLRQQEMQKREDPMAEVGRAFSSRPRQGFGGFSRGAGGNRVLEEAEGIHRMVFGPGGR